VRRGFSAFVSGLALLSSSGCPGGGDSTPSPGTPQPLPSMVQQAYIKPADPNSLLYFGNSVALSGDTLVVGAPADDVIPFITQAVYVFTRTGDTWSQQARLRPSNPESQDRFGFSVAIDGDTLVVGAPGEDSSATGTNGNQVDNSATDSGAVYVFTRTGTTWSQQAYLKASNTGAGDYFGWKVALAGDTLAVSALDEDSNSPGINGNQANNSTADAGAVYVFTRTGTTWNQQAYIKASNPDSLDVFGIGLALAGDGNTLAVGAVGEDSLATGIDGNQGNALPPDELMFYLAGAVYTFTRSNGVWTQEAYIKASNTGTRDAFGNAVALSGDGNTLAVGAPNEESNATGVNGNQADNSVPRSGAVYVFTRDNGVWAQQAYVKASNPDSEDSFGTSVALDIDGNTLVVGAPGEDSSASGVDGNQAINSTPGGSGAVYVFTRAATTWGQRSYLKASHTDLSDGDGLGASVAVLGDTVVAGAILEDSDATSVNGDQINNNSPNRGAAYVYVIP
jgi:hypothetical protein